MTGNPPETPHTGVHERIRILVVDDHIYFRESLAAFMNEQPLFEVVGEAKDGDEAEKMALALSPDIVVMDIKMPKKSGIDAAMQIRKQRPAIKIILFAMYGYEVNENIYDVADQFIPKQRIFEEVLQAIEEVHGK